MTRYLILTILLLGCGTKKKNSGPVVVTTDTSYVYVNMSGAIYKVQTRFRHLKCGLYISDNGQIAFKARDMSAKSEMEFVYLTSIYNADKSDSINGGLKQMKDVVDTTSFHIVTPSSFKDRNHIYVFEQMSDGGTITLVNE